MEQLELDLLGALSFRALDEAVGRAYPFREDPIEAEYPLPLWYRSVYDRPLREFAMVDFNRALHNALSHEFQYLVPFTLHVLHSNPLAGDFYDGDVLFSLKAVAKEYWAGHPEQKAQAREVLEAALQIASSEDYCLPEGDSLLRDLAALEVILT